MEFVLIDDRMPLQQEERSAEKHYHQEIQDDRFKHSLETSSCLLNYCTPRSSTAPFILDLARILEPRPLPPSFHFCQVSGSSSDHRVSAPAFFIATRKSPGQRVSTSSTLVVVEEEEETKKTCKETSPSCSSSSSRSSTQTSTTGSKRKRCTTTTHSKEMMLPESFVPGPYTVVIGRGREARQAPGTQRLHAVTAAFLEDYANSPDKLKKSHIVTSVCRMIRDVCPVGAFVRLGPDGRWHEVQDSVATEKVGYTMREHVGKQYRSSSQAKKIARRKSFETGLSTMTS